MADIEAASITGRLSRDHPCVRRRLSTTSTFAPPVAEHSGELLSMLSVLRAVTAAAVVLSAAWPGVASAAVVSLNNTLDVTQPSLDDGSFLFYNAGPSFGIVPAITVAEGDTFQWTLDFLGDQSITIANIEFVVLHLLVDPNGANASSDVASTGALSFLGSTGETLFSSTLYSDVSGVIHVGQGFGTSQLPTAPATFTFYGVRYEGVVDDYLVPGVTTRTYNSPSLLLLAGDAHPNAGVTEPSTWALMILGFGGAGAALRTRRSRAKAS